MLVLGTVGAMTKWRKVPSVMAAFLFWTVGAAVANPARAAAAMAEYFILRYGDYLI